MAQHHQTLFEKWEKLLLGKVSEIYEIGTRLNRVWSLQRKGGGVVHQRCNIVRQAQLPFLLMASCRLPTWLRDESFHFRKMWARVQKLFFAGGNFPFGDKMEGLEGSRGNWANIVKCCCHHSWVVSKFQVEIKGRPKNGFFTVRLTVSVYPPPHPPPHPPA